MGSRFINYSVVSANSKIDEVMSETVHRRHNYYR